MNKKILVTACTVLALVIAIGSFAVINGLANAFNPNLKMPSTESRQTVSGNGGNAVTVGEYLYFIGHYVNKDTIGYKENSYNKISEGGIYRVKLEQGKPTYEMRTTVNEPNAYRPEGVELVVPKVAGFVDASLFAFDKYLIYASPNNEKDSGGNVQRDKIDFYRVDLDGKNHKRIYTTRNNSNGRTGTLSAAETATNQERDNWTVVKIDGSIYLLVHDGNRLVRVNMSGNSTTFCTNAQSFAFPVVGSYYGGIVGRDAKGSYDGVMRFVYYTVARSQEDIDRGVKGNLMKRYDIANNKSVTLTTGESDDENEAYENKTYTVLALGNNKLLYAIDNLNNTLGSYLYLASGTSVIGSSADKLHDVHDKSVQEKYYLPNETNFSGTLTTLVSFAESAKKLYIYNGANNYVVDATISGVAKVIAVTASYIYYENEEGKVVTVVLSKGEQVGVAVDLGEDRETNIKVSVFRIKGIGERLFYMKQFEHDGSSTTCGVMVDYLANESAEVLEGNPAAATYILRVIADKYLPEELRKDN